MLKEIGKAASDGEDVFRRWFTCGLFDLYLWQIPGCDMHKFQICYKGRANPNPAEIYEDVLTWEVAVGFKFQRVNIERRPSTPLVQEVQPFDISEIRYEFGHGRQGLSDPVLDMIEEKLSALDKS